MATMLGNWTIFRPGVNQYYSRSLNATLDNQKKNTWGKTEILCRKYVEKIKTPKLLGSTNDALFSVERKESLIFSRAPQNKTFPLLMVTFFVYQGSQKGCSSIGRVRSLPITEQMELINHAWFLKSVFYFPNLLWKDCWAKIFRHARSEPENTIQAKFQCFHISVLWAKLLFFTSWLRENLMCEVMLWEMLPKTEHENNNNCKY